MATQMIQIAAVLITRWQSPILPAQDCPQWQQNTDDRKHKSRLTNYHSQISLWVLASYEVIDDWMKANALSCCIYCNAKATLPFTSCSKPSIRVPQIDLIGCLLWLSNAILKLTFQAVRYRLCRRPSISLLCKVIFQRTSRSAERLPPEIHVYGSQVKHKNWLRHLFHSSPNFTGGGGKNAKCERTENNWWDGRTQVSMHR